MDEKLTCVWCKNEFIYTEGEAFYAERSIKNYPDLCPECRHSRKDYMEVKSPELKQFIFNMQFKNRNPGNNKVLDLLNDIETNPFYIINPNDYLYRARIMTAASIINPVGEFKGYSKTESYTPPPKLTRDMRANYRYIPYLYCSNTPYICVCEVRPRLKSLISLATIRVNAPLNIFDLTLAKSRPDFSVAKKCLCRDLSTLFSKPITNDDDTIDYIPTQYIAEYIKKQGYDGIRYKSAYSNGKNLADSNIVIFSYHKCEVVRTNVVRIDNYELTVSQIDMDYQN